MRPRTPGWILNLLLLLLAMPAAANELQLTGQKRWLTVASSKDIDTAIGIASTYAWQKSRVVSSKSGWYAVILGPYEGESVAAVLAAHSDIGEVPKDAHLSRGENYTDEVWRADTRERPLAAEYGPGKPSQFAAGDISYSVTMSGDEDNPGPSIVSAEQGGKQLFRFETGVDFAIIGAEAGILKLDPESEVPELIFTRYTGGAHCCTQTFIVSKPKGQAGWVLVDAGLLDGSGFGYEDLDKDGSMELIQVDNNFLYAFDSYAGSFAPVRIQQLRGGRLDDVSDAPEFRSELRRDLARMEFAAKLDPSLWRTNGYLVGWLAAKMRLGQGEEAWQIVVENGDQNSDFGPAICKTGKPIEDCAFDDLERVPFAKAVAAFMAERDYGELPQGALSLLGKN